MDWVQTVNLVCYVLCALSLVAGTIIGLCCIWVPDLVRDFTVKGFLTCAILFVGSGLGALITRLLIH
jgi:hypothetical protein